MFRRLSHLQRSLRFTQLTDAILVAGGLASISILLHFVYLYGFVAERYFTSTAGMVLYYMLPLVLTIVCFGALRLTPTHRQCVSLVGLAFAALVYGSEVTVERGENQQR